MYGGRLSALGADAGRLLLGGVDRDKEDGGVRENADGGVRDNAGVGTNALDAFNSIVDEDLGATAGVLAADGDFCFPDGPAHFVSDDRVGGERNVTDGGGVDT